MARVCLRCCTKVVEERLMGSSVEEGRMTGAMPVGGGGELHCTCSSHVTDIQMQEGTSFHYDVYA